MLYLWFLFLPSFLSSPLIISLQYGNHSVLFHRPQRHVLFCSRTYSIVLTSAVHQDCLYSALSRSYPTLYNMTYVPHINCTGYRIRKRNESFNSKFDDDMISAISFFFVLIVDISSVPLSISDGGGYFLIF